MLPRWTAHYPPPTPQALTSSTSKLPGGGVRRPANATLHHQNLPCSILLDLSLLRFHFRLCCSAGADQMRLESFQSRSNSPFAVLLAWRPLVICNCSYSVLYPIIFQMFAGDADCQSSIREALKRSARAPWYESRSHPNPHDGSVTNMYNFSTKRGFPCCEAMSLSKDETS